MNKYRDSLIFIHESNTLLQNKLDKLFTNGLFHIETKFINKLLNITKGYQ